MKKISFSICLMWIASFGFASVNPTIKYQDNDASYSIQWNNQFAQINNLVPEIKINGLWVSANQFKTIKWVKKRQSQLTNHKIKN